MARDAAGRLPAYRPSAARCRAPGSLAAAEHLPHQVLRLAVHGQEHAAEILADHADHQQLHARQHQHRDHQRGPALWRLVGDDRLDDHDAGSQRAQGAEHQAEDRRHAQRHHREIEEHGEPEPQQPAQRIVRPAFGARQMVDLQAAHILGDLEDQAVDIGRRPLVARRDPLAQETRDAAEAREIEARAACSISLSAHQLVKRLPRLRQAACFFSS